MLLYWPVQRVHRHRMTEWCMVARPFHWHVSTQASCHVSPQKMWGQKHAKFRSILDHFRLWSRISPERRNISKIGKTYELRKFLLRLMKKSGELWSTNGLELYVSLDPLKCTFLADYISGHRGCCAVKFLHALEIDPGYLAHTRTRTGVHPKNFNRENLKFDLKFSVCTPIISGLVGYPHKTFPGDVSRGRGDNVRTIFGRPAP